jgi:hypothetical protein
MKQLTLLLSLFFSICNLNNGYSQGCQNDIKYPAQTQAAPINYDTVLISDQSFAGDYAEANQFVLGETYIFTSSSEDDVITLRSLDQSVVLAFGSQPLYYTITSDTAFNIHFNTPDCGTQVLGRSTKMIHNIVVVLSNVGINTETPDAALDINGTVKIANDANTPTAGMMRYNEDLQDFEGFDGMKWRSFTKSSAIWGEVKTPVATTSNCFIAEDGGPFDRLGERIDIDGDYAFASASSQDIEGEDSRGSGYILKREGKTFVFHQKVISPTGEPFDQFASGDVDICGNLMIVGSPSDNHEQSVGTAEIFELNNGLWSHVVKLGNGNENFNYHFGQDVAINSDYAAIHNEDIINGIDEIHIYKKVGNNWNQIETIVSPSNSGTFGNALEFYDGELYVGDPSYLSNNVLGGRVSIYTFDEDDNVTISDSIENNDIAGNFDDNFGVELDMHNDKMVISSSGFEVGGVFRSGRVHVFEKSNGTWNEEQIIQENPTTEGADFGINVSIFEDQLLVTTSGYGIDYKSYIYKFEDEWKLEAMLKGGDQSGKDIFGYGAEISDGLILSGAGKTDVGGNKDQGKLYIFCK